MNLNEEPRLPIGSLSMLTVRLTDLLREILRQINRNTVRTETPTAAALTVTVGASPYSYTADSDGLAVVSGGVVSAIAYGRNAVFTALGITAGVVPVKAGDVLRITYTVAPTVSFIPQ